MMGSRAHIVQLRFRYYFEHGSFHGLKYLTGGHINCFERSLWAVVILCSFYYMAAVLAAMLNTSRSHAISFTADTSYLHWNTTFPAVTVCEIHNGEKQWDINEKVFGSDRDTITEEFIAEVSFFTGTCFSCFNCKENCPTNFTSLINKFRTTCEEIFIVCKWNDEEFDCCSNFLPIQTEYGTCFSINSLHTNVGGKPYRRKLFSNRATSPGILEFKAKEDIQVHLHSPEDVPFYNSDSETKESVLWGTHLSLLFNVIEIVNDPDMAYVGLHQRHCRFTSELPADMTIYRHFSYSTCVVQCRVLAQLRLCNCTHHLMPQSYADHYCDLEGLKCLTHHESTLTSLRTAGYNKPGLVCDCMPSCVEPEYSVVHADQYTSEEIEGSYTRIKMQALPSLRYVRNVARSKLDLVVSIGSTASLFFGASLLSVVEVVYYLFIRRWKLDQGK